MLHKVVMLILVLALSATAVQADAEKAVDSVLKITLLKSSVIKGEFVRLEDVADFKGETALVKKAGAVFLGRGPEAGSVKTCSRWQIENALLANGFKKGSFMIEGAEEASVEAKVDKALALLSRRRAEERGEFVEQVSGELTQLKNNSQMVADNRHRLEQMIEDIASRHFCHSDSKSQKHEVELLKVLDSTFSVGDVSALQIKNGNADGKAGKARILFTAYDRNGGRLGEVRALFDIKVLEPVVILKDDIQRGGIVTQQNVEVVYSAEKATRDSCDNLKTILGKRAKTYLRAGNVLRVSQVEIPPLVRKGQTVMVKAINGSFVVRQFATAMQQGGAGEIIQVKNTRSEKIFFAVIKSDGTLELAVPGMMGNFAQLGN